MVNAEIKTIIITERDRDWKERILSEIKGSLLFGISAMTGYQIHEGLLAAKIVKDSNSKIPVVFGGWHPTILPRQTCEHPLVDIVVKGQGERTIFELTKCLSMKGDLNSIKGIVFKKDGIVIETEERPPEDINNFPVYPYNLIDCAKYLYKTDYADRTLNYVSSRGCPHRCSFCAEALVNKRRWVALTADRVLDDFERIVKDYNVNGFTIDDSNFFVDKARVIKICEGLLRKNFKIKWGDVNAHARDMLKYEDDVWELMKKSGLHGLLIGAESGLDDALQLLNKDAVVEDTIKLREKTGKFNIKLHLSLMVGLPQTESFRASIEEEIKSIVNLVRKCYSINKNLSSRIFF